MARILLLEADDALRRVLQRRLEQDGHDVVARAPSDADAGAQDGASGAHPQLVVLGLADERATADLVVAAAKRYPAPLVVLLPAQGSLDEASVLEAGADVALRKPVWPRLLVAYLGALRRRNPNPGVPERLEFRHLTIDLVQRAVILPGHRAAELPRREYELLVMLALAPGRVFSRTQLHEHAWGNASPYGSATVTEHVHRLRKRLGPMAAQHIGTVRSVGYRFLELA